MGMGPCHMASDCLPPHLKLPQRKVCCTGHTRLPGQLQSWARSTAQALNQALPSTWTVTISTPWNFWCRTAAAWCLNSRSES